MLKKMMMLTMAGLLILPVAIGYDGYQDRIPNGEVFTCNTCHYPNNDFYSDFKQNGNMWSADLARVDSDNDGFTNGTELLDATGVWQEGDPDPGNSEDVTNPGDPDSYPPDATATPTNPPHNTPTPTQPPAESPTPVPTQNGNITVTVSIETNQTLYRAGDQLLCRTNVEVIGGTLAADQYVALEVVGNYYFWPTWGQNVDKAARTFEEGNNQETILDFIWPSGDYGQLSGIRFYVALLDSSGTLIGNYDMTEWGYQ